jgi:hypothetical protein
MKLLSVDEREHLRDIFENIFDSQVPGDEAHVIENEDGFVVVEHLYRAGPWYLRPEIQGTSKAGTAIRRFAKYLLEKIPQGESIIVITSSDSQERLCRKIGMREVGKCYRLDR